MYIFIYYLALKYFIVSDRKVITILYSYVFITLTLIIDRVIIAYDTRK